MKKISIYFLICALILFSGLYISSVFVQASESEFTLADYPSDITYSVVPSEEGIRITSENFSELLPIDSPILSCCINQNTIHMLSYIEEKNNHYATYYSFNTNTLNLTYNLSNLPVEVDEIRFAVDSNNNLFLVDRYDNRTINRYCNGDVATFNLNSTIKQLLCLDGENITVITTSGVFLIDSTQATKISPLTPVTPCVYIGNGIVKDSIGTCFTYKNGNLETKEPETTVYESNNPTAPDNGIFVISDTYLIVENGTTVAKLYKALDIAKADLTVYKIDTTELSQGKLGTGMKACFDGKTYNIVIYGELTGEGNINTRDLKLLMKHLTGEAELNSVQKVSADINKDGKLCTKDLLLLSKMY